MSGRVVRVHSSRRRGREKSRRSSLLSEISKEVTARVAEEGNGNPGFTIFPEMGKQKAHLLPRFILHWSPPILKQRQNRKILRLFQIPVLVNNTSTVVSCQISICISSFSFPCLSSPSIEFTPAPQTRLSPGAPWGKHWPAKNIRLIGSLREGEGRRKGRRGSWMRR